MYVYRQSSISTWGHQEGARGHQKGAQGNQNRARGTEREPGGTTMELGDTKKEPGGTQNKKMEILFYLQDLKMGGFGRAITY